MHATLIRFCLFLFVAVCCSVLQCAVVCSRDTYDSHTFVQSKCLLCSVLQCVALCCSVLHCVAVCCSALQCVAVCCSVLQCAAVCCSVLQCVCAISTTLTRIYSRTSTGKVRRVSEKGLVHILMYTWLGLPTHIPQLPIHIGVAQGPSTHRKKALYTS